MKKIAMLLAVVVALTGVVNAGTLVENDITTNTTWTLAMSPIHLKGDIYVSNGASLTIEAGVVVASFVSTEGADFGSLAISQGSDIYVMGTADAPVIMTSAEDVATWEGTVYTTDATTGYVDSITTVGDPATGTWRPVCQEWGSLAIMGYGYISASHYKGAVSTWTDASGTLHYNTTCLSSDNKKEMEGLVAAYTGDTRLLYGGENDNDDSGEIHYLSLRYGGRDTLPNKELNGMSLGAIGRATDIDHVEVMNNVDDGIEIWGGTVTLSHINIWNIGDDSLDVDEGWRGGADTGLIVQGYCVDAGQGSGIGDNCIETDGAEDCYVQPMTTAKVSNFTVVGNSAAGDGGTAWRDNARVQYDNCMWIGIGECLVRFDNCDGDGAQGYDGTSAEFGSGDPSLTPTDGTMSFYDHWTTSYNTWAATPQAQNLPCGVTPYDLDALYTDWTITDPAGSLCQITNSVFYDIADMTMYDELASLTGADVWASTNITAATLPIRGLVRGPVLSLTKKVDPVEQINPLPVPGITAGGFSTCNWLLGWTAADAYGFVVADSDTVGDLDGNCKVDMGDLAVLSANWLVDNN